MIAVTFNPLVLFYLNVCVLVFFQFVVFRNNSPKIEHLPMLLLYASGAFTKLIDVLIEFMNKESVLCISMLEYISDACSETNIVN